MRHHSKTFDGNTNKKVAQNVLHVFENWIHKEPQFDFYRLKPLMSLEISLSNTRIFVLE